jgi:uncharacterized protein (TIGR03086 family)
VPPVSRNLSVTADPGLVTPDLPAIIFQPAPASVLRRRPPEGVLDRRFPLPEIAAGTSFPARQAISFHLVDHVVHSWDVARALGLGVDLAADVLDAALAVARTVPGGASRLAPGSAFAPALAWPGGSPLDQVVAALGRSPGWQPPG